MRDPGWYVFRLICWMFAFGLLPWVAAGVMAYEQPKITANMVSGYNSSTGITLIESAVAVQLLTFFMGLFYSLRLKSMLVTVFMRSVVFVVAFAGFMTVMIIVIFVPPVLSKLNDQHAQATPAAMVSSFLDILSHRT